MPQISVIIPAYNAEAYLSKCLTSLSRQTYSDFETIVLDDCSTDRTSEIALSYGAHVIRLDKRSGAGAARNTAINASAGAWLAFTDADVIVPEKWLENYVADVKTHNVECAAGGYKASVGSTFIETFAFVELEYRRRNFGEFVKTFSSNNCFCRRTLLSDGFRFPENYVAASLEDMVFSFKLSQKHKIFWDKNNGVIHHFRSTLANYVRQQFAFARDTVVTYFDYPTLFVTKTHQGRSLHVEAAVVLSSLAGTIFSFWILALGMAAIFIFNSKFLWWAYKKHRCSVLKTFGMLLARDSAMILGVFAGMAKLIKRSL